jgi:hypothetical protein
MKKTFALIGLVLALLIGYATTGLADSSNLPLNRNVETRHEFYNSLSLFLDNGVYSTEIEEGRTSFQSGTYYVISLGNAKVEEYRKNKGVRNEMECICFIHLNDKEMIKEREKIYGFEFPNGWYIKFFNGHNFVYLPVEGTDIPPFIQDLFMVFGKEDSKIHKIIIDPNTGQINILLFKENHQDTIVYAKEFTKLVDFFTFKY